MQTANPAQVQKFLSGMDYPASRNDVVQHAKSHGADAHVCRVLEHLPANQFQTAADVNRAISNIS
jgi:hypothetical protein